MPVCKLCHKGRRFGRISRHHRGVAGAQWKKRAQKKSRVFKPNLHKFQGEYYCTKCLRKVKEESKKEVKEVPATPQVTTG